MDLTFSFFLGCFSSLRLFLLIVFAFWIHWEPALLHALFLCEELTYPPKGRRSKHAKERREIDVRHEKGRNKTDDADEQIENPRTSTPIILCLDDNRMPDADGEKGHRSNGNTCEMHVVSFNSDAKVRIFRHNCAFLSINYSRQSK